MYTVYVYMQLSCLLLVLTRAISVDASTIFGAKVHFSTL